MPKKIVVYLNESNYDYCLILKELSEEFKKQSTCLGKTIEKWITFSVPIEKKATRIDKTVEETAKNISYILQFIGSTRFMVSSLSNLANNLSVGIHRIECKCRHDDKKCETCGIKYKYSDCKFFFVCLFVCFSNTQNLKIVQQDTNDCVIDYSKHRYLKNSKFTAT